MKAIYYNSDGLLFVSQRNDNISETQRKILYLACNDYFADAVFFQKNGNNKHIRFKENKHGAGLPHSAMIGYVEIKDFGFWYHKVNSWISDKKEHLQMLDGKIMAKLNSKHQRQNSEITSIELTHF